VDRAEKVRACSVRCHGDFFLFVEVDEFGAVDGVAGDVEGFDLELFAQGVASGFFDFNFFEEIAVAFAGEKGEGDAFGLVHRVHEVDTGEAEVDGVAFDGVVFAGAVVDGLDGAEFDDARC
jgi:hypothetical protein